MFFYINVSIFAFRTCQHILFETGVVSMSRVVVGVAKSGAALHCTSEWLEASFLANPVSCVQCCVLYSATFPTQLPMAKFVPVCDTLLQASFDSAASPV